MKNIQQRGALTLVTKIIATGALWSIAVVMMARLRHPMIDATLFGLALALTLLIWLNRPTDNDGGA